jgi:CBS domain-containing protein
MAAVAERVEHLLRQHYVAVEPGESVLEVERLMRMARLRQLPVTDGGFLVGIVWHRDVVDDWVARLSAAPWRRVRDDLQQFPVRSLMRPDPEVVSASDRLVDAARTMLRLDMGCLPAVERTEGGARMIGIVTEKDLLRLAYLPHTAGT